MSFLEAQKVLVKILKIFNYFPYSVCNQRVKTSRKLFLRSICTNVVWNLIFLACHLHYLNNTGSYVDDGNPATYMLTQLEALAIGLCAILLLYTNLMAKDDHIRLFNEIIEIEKRVLALKFSNKNFNEKLTRNSNLTIVLSIGFHLCFLILVFNLETNHSSIKLESFNYITFSFFLTMIMQLMINFISTIENFIRELERNLDELKSRNLFQFYSDQIESIYYIYDKVLIIIELFNKSFGTAFLGIYIYSFGTVSIETYFAFSYFLVTHGEKLLIKDSILIVSNIFCCTPIIILYFKLCFTCHRTKEAVRTK
jgi:7tm Chemosensory receptor